MPQARCALPPNCLASPSALAGDAIFADHGRPASRPDRMLRALTLDLPAIDADADAITAALSAAIARAKVVHFRGVAFHAGSLQAWERIAGGIGTLMSNGEDSVSGLPDGNVWVDVRFDPAHPATFRHSRTAQPPHTDDAYKPMAESADYILFLVERAARQGGETYFIDADELAAYVGEREPELLEKLTSVPVAFAKQQVEGKTTPVLTQAPRGWEVTWNYYNVAPGQSDVVRALREQFQALLCAPETAARLAFGYRLGSDEGVLWHDRKVLHGRTAFVAEAAGERIVWKCCIG